MPQLGETVTEGTITKWFKAVGDTGRARRAALRGLDRQGRFGSPFAGGRRADGDPRRRGRHGRRRSQTGGDRRRSVPGRRGVHQQSCAWECSCPVAYSLGRGRDRFASRRTCGPSDRRGSAGCSFRCSCTAAGSCSAAGSTSSCRACRRPDAASLSASADSCTWSCHAAGAASAPTQPAASTAAPPSPPAAAPAPPPAAAPEPGGTAPLGPSNGPVPSSAGTVLSPVVRKLLSENEIDPSTVPGTGLGGAYHQKRRRECDRCAGSACSDGVRFRTGSACASSSRTGSACVASSRYAGRTCRSTAHAGVCRARGTALPLERTVAGAEHRGDAPPRLHSVEPRSARNRRAEVRWFGTRSSRSTTSVGEPPSTWSAPRRRHLTR